ncbi:MAG: isocitrate lyase [Bacteroidetes bacterium]|nr:isocitrate lyase [Bacteroidota bacterium]
MNKAQALQKKWKTDPRWKDIERPYSAEDVLKLRGSIQIEYTLAKLGAEKLWDLIHNEKIVRSLGAQTGNQAVQQVQAGLKAIYVSGWQVAGDANNSGQTYPDQSLYPSDSVPSLVKRINNALLRSDQIAHAAGENDVDWFAPIIADAEAGFGGVLNAYELMKAMIEAGAAGVHFEDQLSSAKKCGHMGGKVLVPTKEAIQKLISARLAADVMGVPTVLIARTDADSAGLLTSDIDEYDHEFLTGERTEEGFFKIRKGLSTAIARGLAFAPYADLIWCETSHPDIEEAKIFAEAIKKKYPDKLLAYNCSPSFNWKLNLDEATIAKFQTELAAMGYKYQFVTLAGFHSLNYIMFDLSYHYNKTGMAAYSKLQEREFKLEKEKGFKALKHQSFVGAGYFDEISKVITGGRTSITALDGSTEEEQFAEKDEEKLKVTIHKIDEVSEMNEEPLPKLFVRRKFTIR